MNLTLFIANGSEETEAIATLDILRRANIETILVSVEETLQVKTAHGILITADKLLKDVDFEEITALVFSGGLKGVETMKNNPILIDLVKQFNEKNKIIAAICASPLILAKADVLKGKKAICYPGFEGKLNAEISQNPVEFSQNIITGRSVYYSIDFGLKIVEVLISKEKAEEIRSKI